jgi:hypothetical protein
MAASVMVELFWNADAAIAFTVIPSMEAGMTTAPAGPEYPVIVMAPLFVM